MHISVSNKDRITLDELNSHSERNSRHPAMNAVKNDRYPFSPFPIGWFWIEFSENVKKDQLYSKQWLGQQVVYWRGANNQVCVANATCPHLGANLSPDRGGSLQNGLLVCPFHGFSYDGSGSCVQTPAGPPKQPLSLSTYTTYESGGVVFAWWHPDQTAPKWKIPNFEDGNWSRLIYASETIRTHPQETSENGVDLTHLPHVHGYSQVQSLGPLEIEGPLLQNSFTLNRRLGPSSRFCVTLKVSAVVKMWGLGVSTIEPSMEEAGLYVRQFALCTPIDSTRVDFVMALQMKNIERPDALAPGLGLVPKRILNAWFLRFFFSVYKKDISQDFEIWENKKYLTYPRLGSDESAIIEFRRYCEQFYV